VSDKKVRLPRVERTKPIHIEDETSHLWAVSYADFLMVLLSFFIIFFSIDNKKRSDVIEEIILLTSKDAKKKDAETIPENQSARWPAFESKGVPSNAIGALKASDMFEDLKVENHPNEGTLIINMPDNIYGLGQINLSSEHEKRLQKLIKQLLPYAEKVNIVFVGHTDSQPLSKTKTENVKDNFDLSALRASAAVRSVQGLGIPKGRMFLSGSAENVRNTRSLSIHLIDRSRM